MVSFFLLYFGLVFRFCNLFGHILEGHGSMATGCLPPAVFTLAGFWHWRRQVACFVLSRGTHCYCNDRFAVTWLLGFGLSELNCVTLALLWPPLASGIFFWQTYVLCNVYEKRKEKKRKQKMAVLGNISRRNFAREKLQRAYEHMHTNTHIYTHTHTHTHTETYTHTCPLLPSTPSPWYCLYCYYCPRSDCPLVSSPAYLFLSGVSWYYFLWILY